MLTVSTGVSVTKSCITVKVLVACLGITSEVEVKINLRASKNVIR